MWHFHWKLVKRMPFLLWESAKSWVNITGVFYLVVGIFGLTTWSLPPLWVAVPILVLFIYGLMKANYEAFQKVEQGRNEERQKRKELEEKVSAKEKRVALKNTLGSLHKEGQLLHDGNPSNADAEEWATRVYNLLITDADSGEAQRFSSDAGILPINYQNDTPAKKYIRRRLQRIDELIQRV